MTFLSLRGAIIKRRYSHGPTISEVYQQYASFDKQLMRLPLRNLKKPSQIDELVDDGKLSEVTAEKLKEQLAKEKEAQAQGDKWMKIFVYIGIPSIILTGLNAYFIEKEHLAHLEEHPREVAPYSYLRCRTKKFFWGDGDHTLFHNPKVNGP